MKLKIIDLFAVLVELDWVLKAAKKTHRNKLCFSSEIDKYCIQTYITNFGKTNFYGDITNLVQQRISLKRYRILTYFLPVFLASLFASGIKKRI